MGDGFSNNGTPEVLQGGNTIYLMDDPGMNRPHDSVLLGASADMELPVELTVCEGQLYLCQVDPTSRRDQSSRSSALLYVDRDGEFPTWYFQPVPDIGEVPDHPEEVRTFNRTDLVHPLDRERRLQPVGLAVLDAEGTSFRFFPVLSNSTRWNGARSVRDPSEMCIQTDEKIYSFKLDYTGGHQNYVKPSYDKEVVDNNKVRIEDLCKRVTQQLLNAAEFKDVIPEAMRPLVSYDRRTRTYEVTLQMHSDGVRKLIGSEGAEFIEVGNQFGFGSRVIFMEVRGQQGNRPIIRGGIFLQHYTDMTRSEIVQEELLPGITIVATPAGRGDRWTLEFANDKPDDIIGALSGLNRSLRPHRKN